MIKALSAFVVGVGFAVTPAAAFDPNTFEALVIIEPDEEAFLVIGKKITRHLKPGWHKKLPFIEQVAVITTTRGRYENVSVDMPVLGGHCSVSLDASYIVADARRAYHWRRAERLDMRQQRSMFKKPRADYTEPAERMDDALTDLLSRMQAPQAACGSIEAWARFDPQRLRGTINIDGTQIVDMTVYSECTYDQPVECPRRPGVGARSFAPEPVRHR